MANTDPHQDALPWLDPIMLTELSNNLWQELKHSLARFNNDASACYDRIIVALGMLAVHQNTRYLSPANKVLRQDCTRSFTRYISRYTTLTIVLHGPGKRRLSSRQAHPGRHKKGYIGPLDHTRNTILLS